MNRLVEKVTSRPGVDEQRRIIADAAVELFGKRGSAVTSVSDICKSAGVSRDTFYRCFADKKAVISQLYESSVNEHVLAVLDSEHMDFTDQEWVKQVSEQTVDAILAQAKVAQFLYLESADPSSHAYQLINEAYDASAQRMRHWAKQRFGHAPAAEYFKSLLFATQWLVHNVILSGMTKAQIATTKQSIRQLFYAAFSSLECSRKLN